MNTFIPGTSHFTVGGAYYPTGHVFTMFADEAAARAAAVRLAQVPDMGDITLATPAAIQHAFAKRAADVGAGAPSVGREDQFMLRFVELAQGGKPGLLIDAARAEPESISAVLNTAGALLAYYYRALVIEELIDTTPRAEAAAAGKL
ncbi:hypothetical protein [Ottowia testudinis]|uniref:Uncharacterized protein n=1 Tax=Ottowia testudinis TaxID=2816950 RepID=A0A975H2C5_9BURK|nr:hypothetical protein [Ottowia testudinis]QTD44041.1 hypothetical protein J1M35_12945 [Ottowia testudinis]